MASNDSVEADAEPKYAAQGQPMSFKAYHVLVPKAAVADPEPLRAEAALLAKDCGLRPWQRWWSWRDDEWVFGFTEQREMQQRAADDTHLANRCRL